MHNSDRTRIRPTPHWAINFWVAMGGLLCCLFAGSADAAIAEGSASISWSTAYPPSSAIYQAYKVGEDLSNPSHASDYTSQPPSDIAPQSLSLSSAMASASVLANATTLVVESASSAGNAGAEALMSALFLFSGAGTLDISIPYTLSTLVTNNSSNATVALIASFEIFDAFNASTGIIEPTPIVLFDGGLGTPNEVTGILSLHVPYDDTADFFGVLNITAFSESAATPVQTVPIPGAIFLVLPAFLIFSGAGKNLRSRSPSEI